MGTDPLYDGSINDILKSCATVAGLPYVPELSGHSFRRGLATSAHRAGADFKNIKRQGGWRHDGTVQGYSHFRVAGSRWWGDVDYEGSYFLHAPLDVISKLEKSLHFLLSKYSILYSSRKAMVG